MLERFHVAIGVAVIIGCLGPSGASAQRSLGGTHAEVTDEAPRFETRDHPPGLLIAGAVTFVLSWGFGIGAAVYASDHGESPAGGLAWIPLLGGYLAPSQIVESTAHDIYSWLGPVIASVQVVGVGLMIAGAAWFAVGAPRQDVRVRIGLVTVEVEVEF